MAKYNPIYLNAEEKALLKDIEGMDSRAAKRPSAALQARLKKAAREYIAKEAKMNIRIASSDLAQIKARAMMRASTLDDRKSIMVVVVDIAPR